MPRFRPAGLLLLALALLAALSSAGSGPALASGPLLTSTAETVDSGAAARGVDVSLRRIERPRPFPLLKLRSPRRHPVPVAPPSLPRAAAWTASSGESPAGPAGHPPARLSVRLLTGRLNE